MDIEKLKQKILTKMSEKELETKINNIIKENSGLIDEKAAISIIANDLGISMDYDDNEEYGFSIKDIAEGQRNVEITGKIMDISDVREFSRKDGTKGKVRSIIVADNTGSIRLTLWNDKADLVNNLKKGDVVEITNAFSRKWNNKIELNSGSDLTITKIENYDESKYPVVKECYNISELTPNMPATIRGEIIASYDKREFPRKDGTTGRVKSFILKDDTGTIRGTLWDDLAEIEINKGDIVEIKGYVKEGLRGLDINVNTLNILNKGEVAEVPEVNISELPKYKDDIVHVKGRITNISNPRMVKFDDREVEVREIYLMDNTGSVRISFWGNNINALNDITEGDAVKITNCKVKSYNDFEGNEIISLSAQSNSQIIKDDSIGAPKYTENLIKINDIYNLDEKSKNDITTVGRVLTIYDINEFERSDGTTGKVRNIIIEDETGKIRVVLWDKDAELDIKEGDIVKIVHGYAKDNGEFVDLNIGRFGRIIVNPEGVSVKINRKFIKELEEGETAEIRGTVVDYRKQDLILHLCPNCNKRAVLSEGKYICEECGEVEPREVAVATLTVDDGTGNITCKLFGKTVEKITETPMDKLKGANLDILNKLLGEEFIFNGLVNKRLEDLEFSVKSVRKLDLDKEIELLSNL
ncbi:OB-fold nucleic acid binding domain-containing protein [Methanothermococcus okinawensis]|uniref:Nucleic acid binding OB-fold tRNA/helicase-type n=1 Tax=Methanothermococcus okinawensis (strain DSM 14208 / JCM 11175 / IH1) TaxID=647113 RepID=F8AMZ6_METOI|nr:OB-fold nucleic acid binding domain-containing protein [Methanothermococcus okinawensis]AEH06119.1 nucleic acid binding OB-fold tRNA/helicase-type [Methanothermococcus okinawensis IH1]